MKANVNPLKDKPEYIAASKITNQNMRRLNTLADEKNLNDAMLKDPSKGLMSAVQSDPLAALEYAVEMSEVDWQDTQDKNNWGKIVRFIKKNWPLNNSSKGIAASYNIHEENYFDVAKAIYWYCADFHEGQNSDLYSVLSQISKIYTPGRSENGIDDEDFEAQELYEDMQEGKIKPKKLFDALDKYLDEQHEKENESSKVSANVYDLEKEAIELSQDKGELLQRLKAAIKVLSDDYRDYFSQGNYTYDFENKRLNSKESSLYLQWFLREFPDKPISYGNQQTNKGVVQLLIGKASARKQAKEVLAKTKALKNRIEAIKMKGIK